MLWPFYELERRDERNVWLLQCHICTHPRLRRFPSAATGPIGSGSQARFLEVSAPQELLLGASTASTPATSSLTGRQCKHEPCPPARCESNNCNCLSGDAIKLTLPRCLGLARGGRCTGRSGWALTTATPRPRKQPRLMQPNRAAVDPGTNAGVFSAANDQYLSLRAHHQMPLIHGFDAFL